MNIKTLTGIVIICIVNSFSLMAQQDFYSPKGLYMEMPDSVKEKITGSLNQLFTNIANNTDYEHLLDSDNRDFNRNYFKYLGYVVKPDTTPEYPYPQILNLYKFTGEDTYSITLAYCSTSLQENKYPLIKGIYTYIAKNQDGKFVFATPIDYRTKGWQSKTIDEITFYYPKELNIQRANSFVEKNRNIANKLNLPIKRFDVYVTDNYQEIQYLLGVDYSEYYNGVVNNGYIVDPKTLFSVMGNEDFSHDVLHIYAHHIRDKRNVTAEEGLAYTWGDAYYADPNGYIPSQKDLVAKLKEYMALHPDESLLDIFTRNPRIFEYTNRISPKSVISGAICDEIERVKGNKGIIELLQCGTGDDNYLECIGRLLNINKENFNGRVQPLLFR